MANGMRQILLLLIPAAAVVLVLSVPMTRLIYQRGEFDAAQTHLVAQALFWFAFSLPFNGLYLLLTRTFFSLQRPWIPTVVAGSNLVVDIIFSFALYSPFGIGGVVAATVIATVSSVVAEVVILRRQLDGLDLGRLMDTAARVLVAAALLAGVSYLVWYGLDQSLGRSTIAQLVSLGVALAAGFAAYFGAVLALRVPEARQIMRLARHI
jgi:putative peptidoglycan lipid II flippase